jgi:hypothetical protein
MRSDKKGRDIPMTAPESTVPSGTPSPSNEPLSTLRGAGVNYDARRVGQVVVGLCLLTLAVLVVIFSIAGAHRNSQISRLQHDGVPVDATVTKCLGLLGGSGSNPAGYTCSAAFAVHGSRYTEVLPGSGLRTIGSTVRVMVVPDDPALLSPVSTVRAEHTSLTVFLLPAILFVVLLLLVGLIVLARRRKQNASGVGEAT